MTDVPRPSLATLAVWGGELDKSFWERATQLPLVQSASFGYHDLDDWMDVALGRTPGHIYSRNTNPTVAVFEEKVRLLEGAEAATSFATGMAAVSNTLFALLDAGQRVVSIREPTPRRWIWGPGWRAWSAPSGRSIGPTGSTSE